MTDSAHALRIVWALIALLSVVVVISSLYKWRHGQPMDAAALCVASSGVLMAAANLFALGKPWMKVALALVSLSLALAGALVYFA